MLANMYRNKFPIHVAWYNDTALFVQRRSAEQSQRVNASTACHSKPPVHGMFFYVTVNKPAVSTSFFAFWYK